MPPNAQTSDTPARGTVINVHQGDCIVSASPEAMLGTVLGSCISACVRDTVAKVGGMNHFLLATPKGGAGDRFGASARYGAFAMEQLINQVLTRGTGVKANLEIKLFGGGRINGLIADIGAQNIAFAREFVASEGYKVAGSDLGGNFARKVMFQPVTGRVFVKRLDASAEANVAKSEQAMAAKPVPAPVNDDIELF